MVYVYSSHMGYSGLAMNICLRQIVKFVMPIVLKKHKVINWIFINIENVKKKDIF